VGEWRVSVGQQVPHPEGAGPQRSHSMTNNNEILHDLQTREEESFSQASPRPLYKRVHPTRLWLVSP